VRQNRRQPARLRRLGTPSRVITACAVAALSLVACSSVAAPSGSQTPQAPQASQFSPEVSASSPGIDPGIDQGAALAQAYKGTFMPPPASGPKAVKGKTVWWVSCGEAYVGCQIPSRGFKEAAQLMGWNVQVKDGAANADTASAIIRSAIGAKVDAVIVDAFDCPSIKGALEAAKAAKLPVGEIISADCDDPSFGAGGQPLFAFTPKVLGNTSPLAYWAQWSQARAKYVAAKVGSDAQVVLLGEASYANQIAQNQAFAQQFKTSCSGCTLKSAPWTFAQVPSPATQNWQTAIASNPKAKAIAFSVDSAMGLGLLTAIKGSGRSGDQGLIIGGGEGLPDNIALVREGKYQTFATAMSYDWFAWSAADDLNRLLAGENPSTFPEQGGGWQIVDTNHNLPQKGNVWNPPIDYRAAYTKLWTAS